MTRMILILILQPKKRSERGAKGRRDNRKSTAAATPEPKVKEKKRMGCPPTNCALQSPNSIKDKSSEKENAKPQIKKRKIKGTSPFDEKEEKSTEYLFDEYVNLYVPCQYLNVINAKTRPSLTTLVN